MILVNIYTKNGTCMYLGLFSMCMFHILHPRGPRGVCTYLGLESSERTADPESMTQFDGVYNFVC